MTPPVSVAEAIRTRHSIRRFRPDPIPEQRRHPGRRPFARLAFGERYGEQL
ncbi:hypothetical protein [Nocardiopsis nanhaiensis]